MSAITFKARLHTYRFNVAIPAERKQYEAMVATIKANCPEVRGRWMNCISSDRSRPMASPGVREVDIEVKCVFENQWNTWDLKGGERIFDWYEEYPSGGMNKDIKRGHWLELTPELAEVRSSTLKCQYCGKQYGPYHDVPPGGGFCLACLDSEYLKPEDLKLLRLRRLSVPDYVITELTNDEREYLLPLYVDRQTVGNDSRAVAKRKKQYEDLERKHTKALRVAETEFQGFKWLLDQGLNIDNVIYYSHTDRFCFGWRSKISPEVESAVLKVISEFPYQYELLCEDGRKLENYLDESEGN